MPALYKYSGEGKIRKVPFYNSCAGANLQSPILKSKPGL